MELNIQSKLQQLIGFQDRSLIQKIEQHGKLMQLESGAVLMDYGRNIKNTPIILSGVIKVMQMGQDSREALLYYLSAGSTCPTSFTCCMVNKVSEIRAVVEEATELIAIPMQFVDEWMNEHTEWKNFVMNSYAIRFKELMSTIDHIAFTKLDQRLASYLDKKVELTGNTTIHITHKDIAQDLHSTREAISRLLKKMEKLGYVKLARNQIDCINLPQ